MANRRLCVAAMGYLYAYHTRPLNESFDPLERWALLQGKNPSFPADANTEGKRSQFGREDFFARAASSLVTSLATGLGALDVSVRVISIPKLVCIHHPTIVN